MRYNNLPAPPTSISRHVSKLLLTVLLLMLVCPRMKGAVTVTDENGVVYDLNPGSTNVTVSLNNSSVFHDRTDRVVIPATMTDHSTTSTDRETIYHVTAMAPQAFYNTSITSVIIEAPIPEISSEAFALCYGLESVQLPDVSCAIGEKAFYCSSRLSSVTRMEHVSSIGRQAFFQCSALKNISLPEGLLTMDYQAFYESGLESVVIPSTLAVVPENCFEWCSSLQSLEIKHGVKIIDSEAFTDCQNLTEINLPEDIEVKNRAFELCAPSVLRLKKGMILHNNAFYSIYTDAIEWPETAIELGSSVFSNIKNLKEVSIPGWMRVLPDNTFYCASQLESVTLHEGVEEIGELAFNFYSYSSSNATNLVKVSFAEGEKNTLKHVHRRAFYYATKLAEFPFAEGLTIDTEAFYNPAFTSLELKAGMTLGERAFDGCRFTFLSWPESPLSLAPNALGANKVITAIALPAWMTEVPEALCKSWEALVTVNYLATEVKRIGDSAFYGCKKYRPSTLPTGIEEIGDKAFYQASSSATSNFNLVLPSTLKSIGDNAFYGATRLYRLTLNDGLESIGAMAFAGCSKLYSDANNILVIPSTLTHLGGSAFMSTNLYNVDFRKSQLTAIPTQAFYNCNNLSTVYWSDIITEIGYKAFENNNFLTTTMTTWFPSSVKKIGEYAFSNNRSRTNLGITTLDLSNVQEIGAYAFSGCYIGEIVWPENQAIIGNNCFEKVGSLKSVKLPDWMTTTPNSLFASAKLLQNIDLNKTTEIGERSFYGCPYLGSYPTDVKKLTIPSTVNKIGKYAFGATGTADYPYVLELGDGIELDECAFYSAHIAEVIFTGCVEFNREIFSGTDVTKITFPECITNIPPSACAGMTKLTEVVFPEGIKEIGESAFMNCKALTSITFPSTIEKICNSAFSSSGLTSINWPENKVELGTSVFSYTPLTEVCIPRWMDVVPNHTFYECSSLQALSFEAREGASLEISPYSFYGCRLIKELDFPEGLTALGEYAFRYPAALERIHFPSTLHEIGMSCFDGCNNLVEFNLEQITSLGEKCFLGIYKMESISLPDALAEVPKGCFQYCYALKELKLGSGLKTIGANAFEDCRNLEEINFNEGLEVIGNTSFRGANKITRLEFPSSLKVIESGAFAYSGSIYTDFHPDAYVQSWIEYTKDYTEPRLEYVVNNSPDLVIKNGVFENQYFLKEYKSEYPLKNIWDCTFKNCFRLEKVDIPADTRLGIVHDQAFMGCVSLKEFPYAVAARYGNETFAGCKSIKQLAFPDGGDYIINDADEDINFYYAAYYDIYDDGLGNHNCKNFFYSETTDAHMGHIARYTSGLQSIIIPYTGRYFKFKEEWIYYAPLRGVSYCYAKDIIPISFRVPDPFLNKKPLPSIQKYASYSDYQSIYYPKESNGIYTPGFVDNKESILMVQRGEKWKFMEADYGMRFNIMEMKNPSPYLEGDIFSEYDARENVNHYKAILRWEVELSDLNEQGETHAEIYRDGLKAADIVFGKPETHPGSELGLSPENVVVVPVTVEGRLKQTFSGDFDYPIEIAGDSKIENKTLWVMEYNTQDNALYFDAESGARLNASTRYGYKTWLTLIDEFDSPKLTDEYIPEKYTYSLKFFGYDYQEYVNNEDFEPGADGHLYHLETRSLPAEMVSPDCVLYTAVGSLTLDFDGLFTAEQVRADREGKLSPSMPHEDGRTHFLVHELDKELVGQQVYARDRGEVHNVITGLKTIALDEDNAIIHEFDPQGEITTDKAVLDPYRFHPEPGHRYQTVISSFNRGTFGSPVVTIPNVPVLKSSLAPGYTSHYSENTQDHAKRTAKVVVTLEPDASAMGHSAPLPENDDDWSLAIWRTFTTSEETVVPAMYADSERQDEDMLCEDNLLYHWGEQLGEGVSCSDCASEAHDDFINVDKATGKITFVDTFDTDEQTTYTSKYHTRLYVKVPAGMLRTSTDRWMLAAAPDFASTDIQTSIENLDTLSGPDEQQDVRWFDLQGFEIAKPVKGNIYIRVTPQGSSRVRF